MPVQDQNKSSRTRALWIIAGSLATIAICLVLIVIKLNTDKPPPNIVASAPAEEFQADTPEKSHPVYSNTSAPQPRSPTAAKAPMAETPPPEPAIPPLQVINDLAPRVAVILENQATNLGNGIIGRVTFRGTPPPERPIVFNRHPTCPELQTNPPMTRDFIVGTNGALADVFVSVAGQTDPGRYSFIPTNHELILANCKMTPYLSGVLTSQGLRLWNQSANDRHTIRFAVTNNPTTTRPQPIEYRYTLSPGAFRVVSPLRRPEDFIRIQCDQHPWEFAYVCAVETPFHAVTDTNGVFVIPNVPAGKYLIQARHLRMTGTNSFSREVVVKDGQMSVLDFTFTAPAQ